MATIVPTPRLCLGVSLVPAGKGQPQNVVMQMPNELPATYDFMRRWGSRVLQNHHNTLARGAMLQEACGQESKAWCTWQLELLLARGDLLP